MLPVGRAPLNSAKGLVDDFVNPIYITIDFNLIIYEHFFIILLPLIISNVAHNFCLGFIVFIRPRYMQDYSFKVEELCQVVLPGQRASCVHWSDNFSHVKILIISLFENMKILSCHINVANREYTKLLLYRQGIVS